MWRVEGIARKDAGYKQRETRLRTETNEEREGEGENKMLRKEDAESRESEVNNITQKREVPCA